MSTLRKEPRMPLWLAIMIAIPVGYFTILGILTAVWVVLANGPSERVAKCARITTSWWAAPIRYSLSQLYQG